jgi:hypothetical protein
MTTSLVLKGVLLHVPQGAIDYALTQNAALGPYVSLVYKEHPEVNESCPMIVSLKKGNGVAHALTKKNTILLSEIEAQVLSVYGTTFELYIADGKCFLIGDVWKQTKLFTPLRKEALQETTIALPLAKETTFSRCSIDNDAEVINEPVSPWEKRQSPEYTAVFECLLGRELSDALPCPPIVKWQNFVWDVVYNRQQGQSILLAISNAFKALPEGNHKLQDVCELIRRFGRWLPLYKELRKEFFELQGSGWDRQRRLYVSPEIRKNAQQIREGLVKAVPCLYQRCTAMPYTRKATVLSCSKTVEAFGKKFQYESPLTYFEWVEGDTLYVRLVKVNFSNIPYTGSTAGKRFVPGDYQLYHHKRQLSLMVHDLLPACETFGLKNINAAICYADYNNSEQGVKQIYLNKQDYEEGIEDFENLLFAQYARTADPKNILL